MIPDVQTRLPGIMLPLTRVGVSNVRKLLRITLASGKSVVLLANFNCFVDLPSSQKGTHMSRNLEAINEILEEAVRNPAYELEGICGIIAEEVLKRHEYASRCEVSMESRRMQPEKTPRGDTSQGAIKLIARALAVRGGEVLKEVGAEVAGIIVHPHTISKKKGLGGSQKVRASLIVEVPTGYFIKIGNIVEVLGDSLSARAYGFLSEEEEEAVLAAATKKARSVEDVLRESLRGALSKFKLPDGARIEAKCVAEGSLFPHNTLAERHTTFGELRAEGASQQEPR